MNLNEKEKKEKLKNFIDNGNTHFFNMRIPNDIWILIEEEAKEKSCSLSYVIKRRLQLAYNQIEKI